MKILVVASTFPASDTDGVPAFVKDQLIAMKTIDASLNFIVLAPHDIRSSTVPYRNHESYEEYRFHYMWPRSAEKLAGRGIMPALQANPLFYLVIPALFFGEFLALFKLTRQERPDIIYAHWFTPQAIVACLVGKITRTPFVFTTHASDVSVWKKAPFVGPVVVRWNVRRAQAFTAVSRRSIAKILSFFSSSEQETLHKKSKIIPMGVSLFADNPRQQVSTQCRNILFIGRLAEKKGVQYLLPAFAMVHKEYPDARLTIAGEGPWLQRLKSDATSLGLNEGSVTFPGYVTGSRKRSLFAAHEIFVVPSIVTSSGDAEGLPVALMEGMAAGKVCIATDESGADDFITNGENGYLVPQKNTRLLTSAFSTALRLSPMEREAMSAKAMRTARQFSWDTIAASHIEFLFRRKLSK